jgi:citrate lyase beta subunit
VVILVETPSAIENLASLAAEKRVYGIALGGADLSAELGSDMSWDSLLYSRSKIVMHASINGIFSIDSPFMDINDLDQLNEESRKAKSLGFNSKFAIHPNQVETISRNFLPSEEEIEEAKKTLKAFANSDGGAIAVDGKMVDEPVVKLMKKKLILAGLDPDN